MMMTMSVCGYDDVGDGDDDDDDGYDRVDVILEIRVATLKFTLKQYAK